VPAGVLAGIDPALAQVGRTSRLPPVPAGTRLGTLCPEWADRLRLGTDTVVGVGSLDAHAGGVGAGIDARTLVKVMGTSTVDLFLADHQTIDGKDLRHVCGIAEDSIIPGRLGGESGQAAFGDLFAWFADLLAWPSRNTGPGAPLDAAPNDRGALLAALDREAARRGPRGIVAVDWINGRRYPDADEAASGALLGLRIGHDAVDVYRALVEAAVLGSKAIHEALTSGGLSFDRVVLVGGIASKSPHIRQSVADALGVEVMTCPDQEVCARGAALYAAVAAGIFESVPAGQERLCAPFTAEHRPSPRGVAAFEAAFHDYRAAGRATAAFGAREQSLR
jgi:L-ribulokinase